MDDTRHSDNNRKRSRSPHHREKDEERQKDVKRHRSRSPRHRKHHHRESKEKLPFKSSHLHKHDLDAYKPLLADYLDLQKDIDITQLDDLEVRGRWKSFVGKWNRGELAEGWYDPERRTKAAERWSEQPQGSRKDQRPRKPRNKQPEREHGDVANDDDEEEEDDDGYGPMPSRDGQRPGPSIPSFQDLQDKREQAEDDRKAYLEDLRFERKQDRSLQKERLEELAPRAAPGTRERQLEKKREVASSNRAFADAKEAGAEEVGDGDLMGDDGDAYKAKKRAQERQKNERELRKEEILRTREAEREEKLAEHRRKEEKTMEYLRSLAQQRFGGTT